MPKKGSTAVKVTFMTMTLVTPVTAVKFDYGAVEYIEADGFVQDLVLLTAPEPRTLVLGTRVLG